MKKNYTQKVFKSVSIVTVMVFLSHLFTYLLRIVLARNLSPAEYGLFYAVFSLVMFFLIFRDIGLGRAATKFIAQYNVHKDYSKLKTVFCSALLFQLISSSILIVVFAALSSFLAKTYFGAEQARILLLVLLVYVFVSMLVRLLTSLLMGFQKTKWYSLAEPLRVGVTFAAVFPLFYFGANFLSPALAFVIGITFTFLVLLFGSRKHFFILKYPIKDFWKTTKELFAFGIPSVFTGFGIKLISHLDVLLLTYFVSLEKVGIYEVILPTALMFLFIPRAITLVIFPLVSELWERKDVLRLTEGVKLIHTYILLISMPLVLIIFIFADFFIGLLFGTEYVSGILAFRLLLIGVLGYVIAAINHSVINGIGKPIVVTKIIGISAVLNIVLNLILIPKIGITGAAIATMVSYLSALVVSTWQVSKFIKIKLPWEDWFKTVILGVIFVIVITLIRNYLTLNIWWEIFISIFVGMSVFVVLVFILKLIEIKEIKKYLKLLTVRS